MKKAKQLLSAILIILLIMALCACKEDPSLQTAKYKGCITVGYYPGSYLNEPVANIIRAAANTMNLDVYFKSQTEETWQADLHNEEIDIMIDESNDVDLLSNILFTTKVIFLKHRDADLASGGVIGVLDVGFIRDSAMAITDFHNAKYSYYAMPKMLIADFESGHLDGIIVNEVDYLTYSTQDDAEIEYNEINRRDVRLVFENGDVTLLNEFNKAFAELAENGTMQSVVFAENKN
ncbi:MAG: transporter substrate-binding domain-containing protein [Eubacteriales bacterium]